MTREAFLTHLRTELIDRFEWARAEPTKLESWIRCTRTTMETGNNLINLDGPAFLAAWRAIGGKGKPTFKGLRALS